MQRHVLSSKSIIVKRFQQLKDFNCLLIEALLYHNKRTLIIECIDRRG